MWVWLTRATRYVIASIIADVCVVEGMVYIGTVNSNVLDNNNKQVFSNL